MWVQPMNESWEKKRKRTYLDKIISGLNGFRYWLTESKKLGLLRLLHGKEFEKPEKNPFVSVYIPTYNRGKLLAERAVSSILGQTCQNFEIVVVGDHCTDNTEELLSKFKDKRIRFYNLPKKTGGYPLDAEGRWFAGPVGPANMGLKLVKGKWIARVDDDETWTPDHIEVLLKFAQENGYEFVSAASYVERDGKKYVVGPEGEDGRCSVVVKGKPIAIGGPRTWFYRNYLRHFRFNKHCWRKSWDKVNDIDFEVRLCKAGVRMGYLNKPVAYYLPRPGETTIGLDAYKRAEKEGFKEYYGNC